MLLKKRTTPPPPTGEAVGSSASRTLPDWPVHPHADPLAPCMSHSALSCPASGPGHRRAQHPPMVPQSSSPRPPRAPPACPVLTLQTAHPERPWRCQQLGDGARGHCFLLQSPPTLTLGSDPRDRTGRGRWDTSEWTQPVHQVPIAPSPTLGCSGLVVRASTS